MVGRTEMQKNCCSLINPSSHWVPLLICSVNQTIKKLYYRGKLLNVDYFGKVGSESSTKKECECIYIPLDVCWLFFLLTSFHKTRTYFYFSVVSPPWSFSHNEFQSNTLRTTSKIIILCFLKSLTTLKKRNMYKRCCSMMFVIYMLSSSITNV